MEEAGKRGDTSMEKKRRIFNQSHFHNFCVLKAAAAVFLWGFFLKGRNTFRSSLVFRADVRALGGQANRPDRLVFITRNGASAPDAMTSPHKGVS